MRNTHSTSHEHANSLLHYQRAELNAPPVAGKTPWQWFSTEQHIKPCLYLHSSLLLLSQV
jgi:hypothetical protein